MKKKFALLFSAIVCLLLASCMKEHDFDPIKLRSPNYLRYDDIRFGVPVGTSVMNVNELLGNWQNTNCKVLIDPNTQLITFSYQEFFNKNIAFMASKGGEELSPKALTARDTTLTEHLSGATKIDLFKQMPNSDSLNMYGIYADINIFLKAVLSTNNVVLNQYLNDPYITNIKIVFVLDNGQQVSLSDHFATHTIPVDSLVEGYTLTLTDMVNITRIVNLGKPAEMRYDIDLVVPLLTSKLTPTDFATLYGNNPSKAMKNWVKMDEIMTTTYVRANFPCKMCCKNLVFRSIVPINYETLNQVFEQVEGKLGMSNTYVAFNCENGIPLNFAVVDTFYKQANGKKPCYFDANTGDVMTLFKPGSVIQSAEVERVAGTQENSQDVGFYFRATKPVTSKFLLRVSPNKDIKTSSGYRSAMDYIKSAQSLGLTFRMSTTELKYPTVFSADNVLKFTMYLLVNPDKKNNPLFQNATVSEE